MDSRYNWHGRETHVGRQGKAADAKDISIESNVLNQTWNYLIQFGTKTNYHLKLFEVVLFISYYLLYYFSTPQKILGDC